VATAVEMFARIAELNERHDADLVLKAGVHRGPAILVGSRDHPDYFGQAVNAAARLQATAGAGEICLTDDVLLSRDVAALIAGYEVSTEVSDIRGVADEVTLHRVHMVTPAGDHRAEGRSPERTASGAELEFPLHH